MTTTDVSMPAPQHDEPRPGRDEVSLAREPDTDGAAPRLRGEVELGSAEHRERRAVELLGEGALVVRVPSPTRAERGRLAAYLDDAIEGKLLALGASGPYPGVDDTLGDQLFRARAIGASGIVLSLDPLRAIRSPALTPEDSTTLATLAYATRSRSFVFLLDDDDADAPAYGRPVPLLALLDPRLVATVPAPRPSVPAAPPAIPAQAEEIKAIAEVLASPSPPTATTDDTLAAAVEQTGDVRMLQPGQNLSLGPQPRHHVGLVEPAADQLECRLLGEAAVDPLGQVDRAHATLAEHAQQPPGAETLAQTRFRRLPGVVAKQVRRAFEQATVGAAAGIGLQHVEHLGAQAGVVTGTRQIRRPVRRRQLDRRLEQIAQTLPVFRVH